MSLVITSLDDPAALDAVEQLHEQVEPFNTGIVPVRDLCARAAIFEVSEGGALVGHYALETRQAGGHVEGFVLAAAAVGRGLRPAVFTRRVMPLIEKQFVGAASVALTTRRRALVDELQKQGFVVEGYILRKRYQKGNA